MAVNLCELIIEARQYSPVDQSQVRIKLIGKLITGLGFAQIKIYGQKNVIKTEWPPISSLGQKG